MSIGHVWLLMIRLKGVEHNPYNVTTDTHRRPRYHCSAYQTLQGSAGGRALTADVTCMPNKPVLGCCGYWPALGTDAWGVSTCCQVACGCAGCIRCASTFAGWVDFGMLLRC